MLKNTHIWLPGYIKQCLRQKNGFAQRGPTHIMFCLVDHFEPKWGRPDKAIEERRISAWVEKYPQLALQHKDADGRHPRHTFFYPQEEYAAAHLDRLASLCGQGFGEVEIHLHHDNDTAEELRQKIEDFKIKLLSHGLLSKDKNGAVRYGFIHGNWALDNSRKDGRWCGVSDELKALGDTGCYADFTLPSAPSETQTKKINSICYAKDTPQPKSHNTGIDVEVNKEPSGDLMLVQGPLALNWQKCKWGIAPRIENGGISAKNPPTKDRLDLWIKQHITVKGKPDWIFVKVYTHGAQDEHAVDSFFDDLGRMYTYLEAAYNDETNYKLHYVAAREMYNIIKAAEAGKQGEPGEYRDYVLRRVQDKKREAMRITSDAYVASK